MFVFYFETFDRLRQDRVNAMQGFLRKHGLRFSPEDWGPGVRIKIWPDNSVVTATTAGTDAALEGLLPNGWNRIAFPPVLVIRWAFRATPSGSLTSSFLALQCSPPGSGTYGFISWACRELNAHRSPAGTVRKELFHRLERALVLCEFIHHGTDDSDCRILGQRSKSEVLQSAVNGRFRVPQKIMKNQESAGAFRLYATSLESNGFAEAASELGADGLLPLRPTELGAALAREFDKYVPDGFIEFALNGRTEDRETLRLWGKQLCFSDWGGVNNTAGHSWTGSFSATAGPPRLGTRPWTCSSSGSYLATMPSPIRVRPRPWRRMTLPLPATRQTLKASATLASFLPSTRRRRVPR